MLMSASSAFIVLTKAPEGYAHELVAGSALIRVAKFPRTTPRRLVVIGRGAELEIDGGDVRLWISFPTR